MKKMFLVGILLPIMLITFMSFENKLDLESVSFTSEIIELVVEEHQETILSEEVKDPEKNDNLLVKQDKVPSSNEKNFESSKKKNEVEENQSISKKEIRTEEKKSTSSQETKVEDKKEEKSKTDASSSEKEQENQLPKEVIKGICNLSNHEFKGYLENYKKINPNSIIFNSLNEAIAYGELAAKKYGYAYEYDPMPQKFSGSSCEIEFWHVELYITRKECDNNPKIYLPETPKEKLIDEISYLKKLGYNCGTKKWIPIS